MKSWVLVVAALALPSFADMPLQGQQDVGVKVDTLALVDEARGRQVPVAIYTSAKQQTGKLKPAIISHGYGGQNTDYSFIAEYLVSQRYLVASIQHEIAGDEPLPGTGDPYETRKPSWERGVENILFVLAELKRTRSDVDYTQLLLVGHSHGGDTTMLFAQEHPALAHTVISLDNRRMPLPRTKRPRVRSIRSSDQVADEGVIPSAEERAALGMKVVTLSATTHDDMWDGATQAQKAEMIRLIDELLREKH